MYVWIFHPKNLEYIYHSFKNCLNLYSLPRLSTVSPRVYVIFTIQFININQNSRKQTLEAHDCFPFQDSLSLVLVWNRNGEENSEAGAPNHKQR